MKNEPFILVLEYIIMTHDQSNGSLEKSKEIRIRLNSPNKSQHFLEIKLTMLDVELITNRHWLPNITFH